MTARRKPWRLVMHYGCGEEWTTATHLARASRRHTTVWDAPHRHHRRLRSLEPRDRYLWVESGRSSYPLDSHEAPATTAGFLIDAHLHLSISRLQSLLFDVVFVAQRQCTAALSADHPAVHWLPLAAPRSFLELPRGHRYDIAFVGRTTGLPHRTELLATLSEHFRMNEWWRFHPPEEMGEVYAQSRVVLNLPAKEDLNMRFFEGMAAGAALLQPSLASGVEPVATAGVDYLETGAMSDPRRLVAEITWLLSTDLPERVGRAARQHVAQAHTYEHRLAEIRSVLDERTSRTAPIRHFDRAARRRFWAALSRATGDPGLVLHLLRQFPEAVLRHPKYVGGALVSGYRRGARAQGAWKGFAPRP